MYKLHLIQKYLFKRRIAWVALVAVMLCTAMVLVVVSVMGGWLETFQNSFHAMTGDVVVSGRNTLIGFPYYQEIAAKAERCPGVAAAVPVINTAGLVIIGKQRSNIVQVVGYPPDIGRVNGWPDLLHRQGPAIRAGTTQPSFKLLPDVDYASEFSSRNPARKSCLDWPGMIVSGPVVGITHGTEADADVTRDIMVHLPTRLTVLPVLPGEGINATSANSQAYWIVDDAKSRVYQLDNSNVYVAFDELQRELKMDGSDGSPARCSQILVKAKPGFSLAAVRDQVQRAADDVTANRTSATYGYTVETWEQQQGDFIKAVKHEVVLTTALFGVISLVAVLLIFCIFYMIVVEKTRDIGILKSVGATGAGVMSLFLGYGLAIGVVGAGLGVTIAFFFVRYINELHAELGKLTGLEIWSPKTYQFDRIPSKMEPATVGWVVVVAVLSGLFGALVPALRAAAMNPVDSLRYE